jgi:hypothetical protein
MRRLLLSLMALSLGITIGCRHTHTAGICDCHDRGIYHDTVRYESPHAGIEMPREMPKAK